MIKMISIIPIVAATLSASITVYYLYIYIKGVRQISQMAFGVTAFSIFLYALSSIGYYNSTSVNELLFWQRLGICAIANFTISYFSFVVHITQKSIQPIYFWLLRITGSLIIISQVFIQNTLTWHPETAFLKQEFFFGRSILLYEIAPGIITSITYGIGIVVYILALYITLDANKRVSASVSSPILASTIIIFLALINDMLVISGVYHFIYLLELAFIVLIIYISILLSDTIVQSASAKEKLETVNLELGHIRNDLEKKVQERTLEFQYKAEYFRSLVDNSPIAIVTLDNNQQILDCNTAFEALFGYDQSEVISKDLDSIITSQDVSHEARALTEKVLSNEKISAVGLRKRKDGSMVHVSISGVPVVVENRKVGVLGLYQDISASIEADKILRESEVRYRSLFEDFPISLWEEDFSFVKEQIDDLKSNQVTDFEEYFQAHPEKVREFLGLIKVVNINQATISLFKARDKEDLLSGLERIIPNKSLPVIAAEFTSLANGYTNFISEIDQENFHRDILHVILRFNVAPGYESSWGKVFVSIQDITSRKINESKLEYLSTHDQLTSLINRSLLIDRLQQGLARAYRNKSILAAFFIDLDGFKSINDNFGHDIGDKLLIKVSKRLLNELRVTDTVARVGGDEFVIVLENVNQVESVHFLAKKLLGIISAPYQIDNHRVFSNRQYRNQLVSQGCG